MATDLPSGGDDGVGEKRRGEARNGRYEVEKRTDRRGKEGMKRWNE